MGTDLSNKVARLRRAVFARHANPWSAWTRWASTPLVLLPVWTRRWSHAAVMGTWMTLNPVVFREPADDRAWASRALLGEELWLIDRPRDAALGVNAAATTAWGIAVLAARRHRPVSAATATAVQMALLLVYWELMVRYLDRHQQQRASSSGWAD